MRCKRVRSHGDEESCKKLWWWIFFYSSSSSKAAMRVFPLLLLLRQQGAVLLLATDFSKELLRQIGIPLLHEEAILGVGTTTASLRKAGRLRLFWKGGWSITSAGKSLPVLPQED